MPNQILVETYLSVAIPTENAEPVDESAIKYLHLYEFPPESGIFHALLTDTNQALSYKSYIEVPPLITGNRKLNRDEAIDLIKVGRGKGKPTLIDLSQPYATFEVEIPNTT